MTRVKDHDIWLALLMPAACRYGIWSGKEKEESEEGVSSLAVAVPSARSPRLAVNASLPLSRMGPATKQHVHARLVAAAEEIDHLLL